MMNAFKNMPTAQKILISICIMGALFFSTDLSKLQNSLGVIHIDAWVLAIGFIFAQILALSYRWLLLINVYEKKISFDYAVKINIASMLANYLFITSVGGIIVRVALSVKSGVSLMRSIAATGLDRLFTLFALIVMTAVFLPVLGDIVSDDIYQRTIGLIVISVLAVASFSLILFEGPRRKIIFSHRKVAMCFQYLRYVLTNKKVFGTVTVFSLLGQLCYFAAVYFVLASMGVEFSWFYFIAIIPLITVVASLPIGYGGWGIREGAFVYGLGLIDIPFETAFAASIQVGLISMAAATISGVPLLFNTDFRRFLLKRKSH